jgi:hypothetical protein
LSSCCAQESSEEIHLEETRLAVEEEELEPLGLQQSYEAPQRGGDVVLERQITGGGGFWVEQCADIAMTCAAARWVALSVVLTGFNFLLANKAHAPIAVVVVQMLYASVWCTLGLARKAGVGLLSSFLPSLRYSMIKSDPREQGDGQLSRAATSTMSTVVAVGWRKVAIWLVVVPPLYACVPAIAMLSMEHVTVATFVMVRNTEPMCKYLWEWALVRGVPLNAHTVVAGSGIVIGITMFEWDAFSVTNGVGYSLLLANVNAAALERLSQRVLLRHTGLARLGDDAIAVVNNSVGALLLLALSALLSPRFDRWTVFSDACLKPIDGPWFFFFLLTSCAVNAALCSGIAVRQRMTASTFALLSTASKLVLITCDVATRPNGIPLRAAAGVALGLLGAWVFHLREFGTQALPTKPTRSRLCHKDGARGAAVIGVVATFCPLIYAVYAVAFQTWGSRYRLGDYVLRGCSSVRGCSSYGGAPHFPKPYIAQFLPYNDSNVYRFDAFWYPYSLMATYGQRAQVGIVDWPMLYQVVHEWNVPEKPASSDLVVHLRLGDVVKDDHHPGYVWGLNVYRTMHVPHEITRVVIVSSDLHDSHRSLAGMVSYVLPASVYETDMLRMSNLVRRNVADVFRREHNLSVVFRTNQHADADMVYMAHARHLSCAGGGFGLLVTKLVSMAESNTTVHLKRLCEVHPRLGIIN